VEFARNAAPAAPEQALDDVYTDLKVEGWR
jgi:hypothetical protein